MDRDNLAGAIAGAVVMIIAWAVKQFAHVEIPAEVQTAGALLVSLVVTHYTPRKEWSEAERRANQQ